MYKTITKESVIKEIKEILDRHLEADSLDSSDTIADIYSLLRGIPAKGLDDGRIEIGELNEDDICDHIADMVKGLYLWG